jgi:clathrin heavy chain
LCVVGSLKITFAFVVFAIEHYNRVIQVAEDSGNFEELIRYLKMCRQQIKHPHIESELIYSYARLDKMADLEELISGPTSAALQEIADRCSNEKLYVPAKLLYMTISNYPRLASTYICLEVCVCVFAFHSKHSF